MAEIQQVNSRWEQKWHAGDAGWHKSNVNPKLEKYFPVVSQEDLGNGKTVLVPFCGKTLDMKWFCEQGMKVVGIEAIEMPIIEFFEEQNLSYERNVVNDYEVFTANECDLKIFKGNLFQFGVNDVDEKFDFLWDRGALVAVDVEIDQDYINHIANLMKKGAVGLLEVYEYDKAQRSGHPHPKFPDDLTRLCKDLFHFEEISREFEAKDENSFGVDRSIVLYKLQAL